MNDVRTSSTLDDVSQLITAAAAAAGTAVSDVLSSVTISLDSSSSYSAFTLATCCHTCRHTSHSTCCSPCISMKPFTLATSCSTCVRECCWNRSHWRHVATHVADARQFHSPEVAAARRLVAAHVASVKGLGNKLSDLSPSPFTLATCLCAAATSGEWK